MYLLKESPEDFIVEERMDPPIEGKGRYAIVIVKKRETTTFKVIELLSRAFQISRNDISYAGVKDRHAVTTQYMALRNVSKRRILAASFDTVDIRYLGQSSQPIRLGQLEGNRFTITVRDLDHPLRQVQAIPNYFDRQRFSTNNIEIGRALLKGNMDEAVRQILAQGRITHIEKGIKSHLAKRPNDVIGALRTLQPKLLMMYVSAYQSWIFNRLLSEHIREVSNPAVEVQEDFGVLRFPHDVKAAALPERLPMVGFHTEPDGHLQKILQEEGISPRSFIIRQIPEATAHGGMRKAWIAVKDLNISAYDDGSQTVSFALGKGSYATMVIRAMYVLAD
ncbi:MAG: tRNA pseudouridine(13) synthase TruD [Nanoarchaeota archaeon]